MKVKIVSIEHNAETLVGFECSAGLGCAVWLSHFGPNLHDEVDVEFNVDAVIKVNLNAFPVKIKEPMLSLNNDDIRVSGYVEAQDDDGVLYLRLSPDCLMMIESETLGLTGKWISIVAKVQQFKMTPFGWQSGQK